MEYLSLAGKWEAKLKDGSTYPMQIPGTLDENQIGGKDLGANQWHPDADLGNAEKGFDPDAPIATVIQENIPMREKRVSAEMSRIFRKKKKGYFWKWREQDA